MIYDFFKKIFIAILFLNLVYIEVYSQELKSNISYEEFFKGGIVKKSGKEYGVYIVERGDSVWVIAIKYAKFLKGESYSKKDVGNISYWINRINYSNYPGGVKNRLKIGERVLVPIEMINKSLGIE